MVAHFGCTVLTGSGDGEPGVGQHRQGDVGIPRPPRADLVVIQPGFVVGLLETFLDTPAGAGDPGQVQQARAAWSVADVAGDLGRIADRAPREQPVPAAGPPAGPSGIRAQSYSRGPCAPTPTDSRRHDRAGRPVISSSARASASPVVVRVSLTLVASTYAAFPPHRGRLLQPLVVRTRRLRTRAARQATQGHGEVRRVDRHDPGLKAGEATWSLTTSSHSWMRATSRSACCSTAA